LPLSRAHPPPSGGTVAAGIERQLALEIMRGGRAPGSQLPPVRTLARQHGVTAPTIQRVIDRLQASGLVEARRGSGVTVNDPRRSGDLSLLPLWLEALADQPARAAAILADFLELRRVMALHLAATARARIAGAAPRLLALLEQAVQARSLREVAEADVAFTGAVVEAAGQFAVATIFHTGERLVREVPGLREALYGDRAYHRRVLRQAARALAVADVHALDQTLAAWDRRTVARFARG
jgi:DNA-binding FadR family transcriptional regulator